MDGIDVALLETDGETVQRRGPSAAFPYSEEFRALLRQAVADAVGLTYRGERIGCLAEAERRLTELHAEAVLDFRRSAPEAADRIDVIGFHGQTVLHRPDQRLTVQLGDGEQLARLTGIDVVYDVRAADVSVGGEGAPLVPAYHGALADRLPGRPVAFLNIGGVANVTWIGPDTELIAFDTGPGNGLIDDWMLRHTGWAEDTDGKRALSGKVDAAVLRRLLMHPYFAAVPPKSLDRNAFSLAALDGLSVADGAATLVAFTARAVQRAVAHLPEAPKTWVVCGGGRRNPAIMAALAAELDAAVVPAEMLGLDGSSMEAEAWAFLAVRSLRGLPLTFPMTTGVPTPTTGGVLARSKR